MKEQAENLRRHHPYTGSSYVQDLVELVIAMATQVSDLQTALSTQQSAILDLQTQVASLQAGITPAPDLQPVLDGINANTSAVKAISATLPPITAPAPTPAPATPGQ